MMHSRRIITGFLLLVLFTGGFSCVSVQERQQQDYGLLMSAVAFSADKVYGEYAEAIPADFDGVQFLVLVQSRIPEDYYGALRRYRIDVTPRSTYYLLAAYDGDRLILFDFSCTKEVDGAVLLHPGRYDLANLPLYDPCR